MTTPLFILFGAIAGVLQAGSLARAARGAANPFAPLLRLLAVGAVLVVAARAGALLAAAAGWLAGFVIAAVVIARRLR